MPERTAMHDLTQAVKIHYESTTSYKLIYVFRVNDRAHEGLLKVGDTVTVRVNANYSYQAIIRKIEDSEEAESASLRNF